jgi:cbb3-type cytochrome oxidase subunit 3
MKQEALKYFADTYLTAMGLLIFFGFFVATVLWVYRKHSKTHYARMTQIPLQSDGD